MSGDPSVDIRPVVVGLTHRSSPAALRDRVFIEDGEMGGFLAELRAAGIGQAIVLSTCDRVEVEGASADPGAFAQAVLRLLAARSGLPVAEISPHVTLLSGDEAARQIFAVAAALESQVIGEPQVLGQVKEAHRRARDAGLIGPELDSMLQAAYGAAKRVRSETAIGERPVTLASAALQVARDVHGNLSTCSGLLIGSGEMGELLVEHLRAAGLKRLLVTAPNAARAEALARSLAGHVVPFQPLAATLAEAEIVIAAAGSGRYLIHEAEAADALRRRRRRAMLFLDLGVPADIDPAIEPLDGAFRYDLDDLERVALSGRVSREQASAEAWAIVDAELAAFARDRAGRSAVPAIAALRRHFESHRARVLVEAGGDAVRATELLINRLLHDPSQTLRRLAAAGHDAASLREVERLLQDLFGLKTDGTGAPPDQETKT
jgi:glutamyl-tRNA reductase